MGKRFIIEVDGVYYMTDGPLLVYDDKDAKDREHVKSGIKLVKDHFKKIKESPDTWYYAVEVKEADFAAAHSSKQ